MYQTCPCMKTPKWPNGYGYVTQGRLGTFLCTTTNKIYCALNVRLDDVRVLSDSAVDPLTSSPQIHIHHHPSIPIATHRETYMTAGIEQKYNNGNETIDFEISQDDRVPNISVGKRILDFEEEVSKI